MKRLFLSLMLCAVASIGLWAGKYEYETVEGDPLNTKMYTLPNGLKLFMSVNKDQPRIQTYVAVRVGGKNDPAETTGLAHYFEHLMFKGTEQFGTTDYAKEKPLLDQIEQLFEKYRKTTDEAARKAIYRQIDSVSYEASKIAIPNEYDKLMSAIGANGTNAYTSNDVTCYVENIPSNQIENWAKIQADRFEHPVIRGFHTELETIYEEKNMSLTNDNRKIAEKMLATLFPHHPYGTQTVLGTQEHLKNPSITNVKNYHKQWYVPNNMAICVSGDFDPDNMVDIISKYFGHLKPNNNLPAAPVLDEAQIAEPINVDVLGKEAEFIYMAWRIPEAKNEDMTALTVMDRVLNNGSTGLLDIDVNLAQKALGVGSGTYGLADGGAFILMGRPKGDQSLDDVRSILLEEVGKLRRGEFDEEMISAIVANEKLGLQRAMESNEGRADMYVDAFVNGEPWADAVKNFTALEKISKDDVVRVANKYLGDNNYVALYKRQGTDPEEVKIGKPELTPIVMNRDASSAFLNEIQNTQVEPIEPVFLDFNRDLTFLKAKQDIPVYYTKNTTNDIFSLVFVYNVGSDTYPYLDYASELMELYGTETMSAADIQNEFYKLACSYNISVGGERTYIVLSGLSENMPKALELFQKVLKETVADPEAYAAYADRLEKSRLNQKSNQSQNFSRLRYYLMYGKENAANTLVSVDEFRKADPVKAIEELRMLPDYECEIIYYGNAPEDKLLSTINTHYQTPETLKAAPKGHKYQYVQPEETIVFVAPYEAKQLYMAEFSNRGEKYDPAKEALRQVYNEYFGGSMNAIVFQEMRESRSLAYSAGASFNAPSKADNPYTYSAVIATQNDKMGDAIAAFSEIINDMPESESAFDLAKKGLDSRLRTERIIKDNIAWAYINAKDLGIDTDRRKNLFDALPGISLADVAAFQKDNVKGRTYYYAILGDTEDIDMEQLKKLGKVVVLTTEEIFGY